ncbi:hypothetical protein [Paracoccus sp. IB05]|uniref:hypothetical protein n=1 Tax=Paracoccus sp. IB05 TaxID=2779367 RepID=UPI0018E740EA|nr:hypothetical protein [Paracoccus sp. IB05]MBJ2154095.1 hypothetical protein [Paracoccus sp. IB05]
MINLNLTPFKEGIAMTTVFDDSYYTAFFEWAFEPAPIGRPCPDPVHFDTVRFGTSGTSVDVMIGGVSHEL